MVRCLPDKGLDEPIQVLDRRLLALAAWRSQGDPWLCVPTSRPVCLCRRDVDSKGVELTKDQIQTKSALNERDVSGELKRQTIEKSWQLAEVFGDK
jgi:hypothetical protein